MKEIYLEDDKIKYRAKEYYNNEICYLESIESTNQQGNLRFIDRKVYRCRYSYKKSYIRLFLPNKTAYACIWEVLDDNILNSNNLKIKQLSERVKLLEEEMSVLITKVDSLSIKPIEKKHNDSNLMKLIERAYNIICTVEFDLKHEIQQANDWMDEVDRLDEKETK